MEKELQTSFIPKSALSKGGEVIAHTVGLGLVVAIVVLLLSLLLWGGSYAYKHWLTQQTDTLQTSINKARQNLDQATTVLLKRVNDKLRIGQDLLGSHLTLVPIFHLLEELTLPSVYYTKFGYASPGVLTIEGRASSYEDIAVQTRVFSRDQGRIKSFIFSDIDLDGLGNVIFRLVLNLEPEVTSYTKALTAAGPNPSPNP